jgi:hypothetical protein
VISIRTMKEQAFSAIGLFMKEADTLPELIFRHGPLRGCFLNLGDALLKRARQIADGRVVAEFITRLEQQTNVF